MVATEEAAEHEALLQFMYLAPVGLAQLRPDGAVLMMNPRCAQLLLPLAAEADLDNLFQAMRNIAPDLRTRVEHHGTPPGTVVDALQLQIGAGLPGRDRTANVLSLTLLKLDDERLMAVLSDITVSVARERELKQSQAWIHTLVSGEVDYGLTTLDATGCIQTWSEPLARVTGFSDTQALGQRLALFYPPDSTPEGRLADRLSEAAATGWSLDEGWRLRQDGSRYWGSCLIAPLQARRGVPVADALVGSGSGTGTGTGASSGAYSLVIRDISHLREATEALRQAVACDHLTGLANRRAFFEAGEHEIERWLRAPRPLSLVMIDADHFKHINDRHGHAAGDAVLRHLAQHLHQGFRSIDLVARIGGEEFAVLLPGADAEAAERVAQALCQHIAAQTVAVDGSAIRYTLSAGVATMAPGVAGLEGLLRQADAALYAAKSGGRNRVCRFGDDGAARAAGQGTGEAQPRAPRLQVGS